MTTSAPPPRDPELAADPDYRQAAAEDWWGRVADYYADQQAEADQEARAGGPGRAGRPARCTRSRTACQAHDPELSPARSAPEASTYRARVHGRRPGAEPVPEPNPGRLRALISSTAPHGRAGGRRQTDADLRQDTLASRPRPGAPRGPEAPGCPEAGL